MDIAGTLWSSKQAMQMNTWIWGNFNSYKYIMFNILLKQIKCLSNVTILLGWLLYWTISIWSYKWYAIVSSIGWSLYRKKNHYRDMIIACDYCEHELWLVTLLSWVQSHFFQIALYIEASFFKAWFQLRSIQIRSDYGMFWKSEAHKH